MQGYFERTERLLGSKAMQKLKNSHVAVFGIGGVGSYAVEALVRSGIGAIDLIDNDQVASSNINRQLIATSKTIGRDKVDVAKERCLEINPEICVRTFKTFILPETADQFDFSSYDYVVDAIDTVSGKIAIIEHCVNCAVPVISSMGTGNKLNPAALEVADISETTVCPLARVMRRELRARNIAHLKVVYSKEVPIQPQKQLIEEAGPVSASKPVPASIAFVPSAAGLIIAGEVIKDLA